jgi:organic radical activating enzyme
MVSVDHSTFCPLPFAHVRIAAEGTYNICCRHSTPKQHAVNVNDQSLEQWKNSTYFQEVKNNFIQGKKHPGCENCWQIESLGQQSYRQMVSNDYKFFKIDTGFDKLVNVEINLSNLCNLKCLMCNEKSSSAILAENQKLGINLHEQKDFAWTDRAYDHLQQILKTKPAIISIVGGEPLYNKELLNLLEKTNEDVFSNTMLSINTNATVWNHRWEQVIKKFKLVRFVFSLDASQDLYEYIRFPSSWNLVCANIQQIQKMHNVKTYVNCVVQNLNINNLYDLIVWCRANNIDLLLTQLRQPSFLVLTNLPTNLKKQAIENLEKCLSLHGLTDHVSDFLRSCQQQLRQSLLNDFDQDLWINCRNYLQTRDQLRSNSHKKFLEY